MCMQFPSLLTGAGPTPKSNTPIGSEDCLYLDVYAPAEVVAPVPVMVWIHGGGNTIGLGGTYDGSRLAVEHDLVVVTINYRLGPFGWFSHPALADEGVTAADASGNYGTLDTIAALEWVQDHITAFGGDPNRVTIFGESAGGTNVLALLASPLATGLFHRAIVQSGGLSLTSRARASNYRDDVEPGHAFSGREVVNTLLVSDGRAADRDEAKALQDAMAANEIRSLLMAKSAAEIMAAYSEGMYGVINMPKLVADGEVLPDQGSAADIFADATTYNPVPVMLGTNRDEIALFLVRNPRWTETRFWLFPRLKDVDGYRRYVSYQSRAWKVRGVDELANFLSAAQGGGVFAYRFDWDEEPSVMGYDLATALGAAHGLEIAFVFGTFDLGFRLSYIYPATETRDALSRSMMSYWAAFAYEGDPGRGRSGSEVPWTPWGENGDRMIVLDTETDGGIRMSDQEVSFAELRTELVADGSFTDIKTKCELYAQIFGHTAWFDAVEYGSMGCSEWSAESFMMRHSMATTP